MAPEGPQFSRFIGTLTLRHLIPNIEYQRINGKNWTDLILSNFKILIFKSVLLLLDRFWTHLNTCPRICFAKSLQKNCLYIQGKLQTNPSVRTGLKIFIVWPYGFENLGFLKNVQGCNEVKNSMSHLQVPRLMAWTTKSPIQGNHRVPSGRRALLGSVQSVMIAAILCLGKIWLYLTSFFCLLYFRI